MQVLISHSAEDEPAAAAIKDLIRRCSLNGIDAWYSSDRSAQGGMPIGGPWFGELQAKLKSTDWVIALATPQSIQSPWLHFECGFAAANKEHSVVPVVVGLPISKLPMPLAAYQVYDGANSASLATFTQKLLQAGKIPFDEEMTKPVRDHAQRILIEHANAVKACQKTSDITNLKGSEFSDLKSFIDQRFKELYETIPEERRPAFKLELRFDASGAFRQKGEQFTLNIPSGSSVGDVLDEVYFRLADQVPPFTFLLKWTLVDTKSGEDFSIDMFKALVPAPIVFKSDRLYRVKLLQADEVHLGRNGGRQEQ